MVRARWPRVWPTEAVLRRIVAAFVSASLVSSAAACGGASDRREATDVASVGSAGARSKVLDEVAFCALMDALVEETSAELRDAAAREALSREEAEAVLARVVPKTFESRLKRLAVASGYPEDAVARFVDARPDEAARCATIAPKFLAQNEEALRKVARIAGWSGAMRPGPTFWREDAAEALRQARQQRTPAVVFFTAQWCVPCRAVEDTSFGDGDVQRRVSERFVAIRADVTDDGPSERALRRSFKVKALPTLLVLDADGREVARSGEVLPPSRLLGMLVAAEEARPEPPAPRPPKKKRR
jgi:thiol-disulfide isomerase/thioredoxin